MSYYITSSAVSIVNYCIAYRRKRSSGKQSFTCQRPSMLTALINYDVIITYGATRVTITLNIIYSVTLSVYQHRADIERKCSANRATGSYRFEYVIF